VWSDLLVAAALLATFGVGFFAGRSALDGSPPPFTGDRRPRDPDGWWPPPGHQADCPWCDDHDGADTAPWGRRG